eukprot:evm.model.scf_2760.3 EVM.evm.TU.scf_2760.3   scf_2760:14196-17075(+)
MTASLDGKIEKYREDPMAFADLERRVRQHVKRRKAVSQRHHAGELVNFVAINATALTACHIGESPAPDATGRRRPHTAPPGWAGARPGTGGSPTRREEYVRCMSARADMRRQKQQEVARRRDVELEGWFSHKVALANRYGQRKQDEMKRLGDERRTERR